MNYGSVPRTGVVETEEGGRAMFFIVPAAIAGLDSGCDSGKQSS